MSTQYPCRVISDPILKPKYNCPLLSEYFAKNNKAKYGHICRIHYDLMTIDERKDYELG